MPEQVKLQELNTLNQEDFVAALSALLRDRRGLFAKHGIPDHLLVSPISIIPCAKSCTMHQSSNK